MALSLKEASERLGIDLKTLNKRMISLQITPEKSPTDGRSKQISDLQFRLLKRGKSAQKKQGVSAQKSPDDSVYIYALVDPETKEVRWVGQAVNPTKRFQSHMSSFDYGPRADWIADLKKRGLLPVLSVLEQTTKQHASQVESHWMEHYTEQGMQLLNKHQPDSPAAIGVPTKTATQLAEEWGVHLSTVLRAADRASLTKLHGAGYSVEEAAKLRENISRGITVSEDANLREEVTRLQQQVRVLESQLAEQVQLNERIARRLKVLTDGLTRHHKAIGVLGTQVETHGALIVNLHYSLPHYPGSTDPRLRAIKIAQEQAARNAPPDAIDEGGQETLEKLASLNAENEAWLAPDGGMAKAVEEQERQRKVG